MIVLGVAIMASRAPFVVATCEEEGKRREEAKATEDTNGCRDPLTSLVASVAARDGLLLLVGEDEQALVFMKRWLNTPSQRGGPQAQACRSGLVCAKTLSEVRSGARLHPCCARCMKSKLAALPVSHVFASSHMCVSYACVLRGSPAARGRQVEAAAGHFPDNVAVALVVRVDDPPKNKFPSGSPLAEFRAYFADAASRGGALRSCEPAVPGTQC